MSQTAAGQCPPIERFELLNASALGEADKASLLEHISRCESCRAKHAQLARELGEMFDELRGMAGLVTEPLNAATTQAKEPSGISSSSTGESVLVPGFRDLVEISRGGQGVVYQAVQQSTGKKVALKIIREGPLADPRNRARLERGVRILSQLNHPNIVRIIDSGTAGGAMYYVMDFIPGRSLDEWLAERQRTTYRDNPTPYRPRWRRSSSGGAATSRRRQQNDIDQTVRLYIKICDAVHAAHLHGVIHRDLKPGNVRVDDRNEPHILDFDLAKILFGDLAAGEPSIAKTVSGEFLGSLRWASPEQVDRVPSKIDVRTDVYSLGVMLYEALTGAAPYPMLGTRREIEDHILNTDPQPPSRLRSAIDEDLDAITLKCLAKPQERRYHSAGAVADDLRSFLAGAPISARRDSTLYLIRKLVRRHKLSAASLGSVVVIAISAFSVSLQFYLSERTARQEQGEVAEKRLVDLKQATRTAVLADAAIRRMSLGWFLHNWHAGLENAARQILAVTPPRSPEYAAMLFLLDAEQDAASFVAKLQSTEGASMAEFVAGERALKFGDLAQARRSFERCRLLPGDSLYRSAAEERLKFLAGGDQPGHSP